MDILLNVYNADMKTIKKQCKAETIKIPFGTIRKLMKLFNIDNVENTGEILNIVMSSWDSVIGILDNIFPEMTEDDWDTVDTKELVSVIYQLLKDSFKTILSIPTDPKN